MSHIKLHEATKEFKISNKLAMFVLEKNKMPVKSHSSVINFDQLEMLREFAQNPAKFPEIMNTFGRPESKKKAVEKEEEKKTDAKPKAEATKKAEPRKAEPKKPETKKPEEPPKKKPEPVKIEIKKAEPARPVAPPPKPRIEPKPPPAPVPPPAHERRPPPPKAETRPPAPAPSHRPFMPRIEPKPSRPPFGDKRLMRSKIMPRHAPPTPPKPRIVPKPKVEIPLILPETIQIPDLLTPRELAEKLGCKLRVVEEKLEALKLNYQGNEIMNIEDVKRICQEFNVKTEIVSFEDYVHMTNIHREGVQYVVRPPVVTVMGHVDHGKTTLLDTLRKTRVAEKEAGGITQKIGAYKLSTAEGTVIFIDTPGHEAFTNLRARGAKVTDLVILVVAANDGVQPQTVEAIQHARAANVPMIIAINKIDIPGADATKVKQELSKQNVLVEEWGGDVVSVEISAKLNQNLGALLEMIHLVAQMQELKAYKNVPARGTIIEARLDPQLGPMATVLIQHGRLKRGDNFICGNAIGKIKSVFDDSGQALDEAEVPDPVEIMGFATLPAAGDIFQVIESTEKAEKVIDTRRISEKDARSKDILAEKKLSFQNLFQLLEQNKTQVFPVVIKADNFGSSEVLEQVLLKQSREKLKIEIIYKGIGNITESDILLASATGALIIGFNVKTPQKVLPLAKRENIEIKLYNVIYHLIEDISKAVQGKIAPEYRDQLIGKAEVLQKFKISKVGFIAGCMIQEGKVTRKSKVKVLRGSDLVFEGEIDSLKRIKDDASEVKAGLECGIRIKNFNAIEPGDILEIYESVVVK